MAEVDVTLNLPFKMDELVNFTYGFDQLKKAIEYLLNQNQKQASQMERFERDLKGKDNAIGKLNDRMAEKDKEIQELKDKIKELEDKTVHHDN